jgi:hypothetical protein
MAFDSLRSCCCFSVPQRRKKLKWARARPPTAYYKQQAPPPPVTSQLSRHDGMGVILQDRPPSPYYYHKRLPASPTNKINETTLDAENQRMTLAVVTEVLKSIGEAISHVPYTICGLGAMVTYGFDSRLPSHVSILCPAYSKEAIKTWAAVSGMTLFPDQPNYFGTYSSDGKLRRVRIKYVEHGFESLTTIRVGRAKTLVLTLPAMIDQCARAFTSNWQPLTPRQRRVLAQDIFWLLHRVIDVSTSEQALMPERVPNVLSPMFWDVFTSIYPESVGLFSYAGLEFGLDSGPKVRKSAVRPYFSGVNNSEATLWTTLSLRSSNREQPIQHQRQRSNERILQCSFQ